MPVAKRIVYKLYAKDVTYLNTDEFKCNETEGEYDMEVSVCGSIDRVTHADRKARSPIKL